MMESGLAGVLANLVFQPLVRQISYVFQVGEKVDDLVRNRGRLQSMREDIQRTLSEQLLLNRCPNSEVQEWSLEVHNICKEVSDIVDKFERGCKCFGRCSGNICFSHQIGRSATQKLVIVKEMLQIAEERFGSPDNITHRCPPPPGEEMPGPSNLLGLNYYVRKVLGYLAVGAPIIGVVGMAGVGKTALLNTLYSVFAHGYLSRKCSVDGGEFEPFGHVVWVTVSKDNAQLQRLQETVTQRLQVPLDGSADEDSRRTANYNFLNGRRFVLLLDDVWERLDLDEIGIPEHGGTVIFGTRSEMVCAEMGARDNVVKVERLKQEEAWQLFNQNMGEQAMELSPEVDRLAKEIAEECGGLPLALVTIGRAMSTRRTPEERQLVLTSMKESLLHTTIPDIEQSLFPSLKLSYDHLQDETLRQCFLCCALFPERYGIRKDELIECFLGHDLIEVENFEDMGEVYDYGESLIENLKSASVLDSGEIEGFVKLHDMLRQMALWIYRDCGQNNTKWVVSAEVKNWELATRLSLTKINTSLEPKVKFQNLSTLMLRCIKEVLPPNYLHYPSRLVLPPNYFHHFPAMTYLDLSYTYIEKLPEDVATLGELQYLNLTRTPIRYLRMDLVMLKKLKHLILRDCGSLQYIPSGLISGLPVLQVFDIYGSRFEVTYAQETEKVTTYAQETEKVSLG